MNALNSSMIPKCYPEFGHISRFFDKNIRLSVVKLLPGDFYITENEELITTVLGSCISVCAFDERRRIGGMNHFMLPQEAKSGSNWDMTQINSSTRFGNFAMEQLINSMLSKGCRRSDLVFKVFGGGNIMQDNHINIGDRNIQFAHSFLKNEGFNISVEDVGDIYPRKVHFSPNSGKVQVKKLASVEGSSVKVLETAYNNKLKKEESDHGDVELF
ncbi:MAG: chemoreceptor glutamine deamidase CheD [Sinobacterium sp.]|nr:chemoreceptor glutamine deamidase CheD [Sinobacterium sp.]